MGPNTQIPGTISSGTIASGPTPPPKKTGLFGRKPARVGTRRPASANTIPAASTPAAPVAPAAPAGDVILPSSAPETEKRSKLPILIIAGLFVAVIGAAAILMLSINSGKKSSSGPAPAGTVSVATVREKFAPYYNYLVFGTTAPENATVPEDTDNWYFATLLDSDSGDFDGLATYAEELVGKFVAFYNSATGISSNELSDINLANYQDIFYATAEYFLIDSQTASSVNDSIFTRTYELGTAKSVIDCAKKYLESDTEDLNAYANFMGRYSMMKLSLSSATQQISEALGGVTND